MSNNFKDRVVIIGATGFVGKALSYNIQNTLLIGSNDINLLTDESSNKLASLIRPEDVVVFISALTPDKGRGSDTLIKNIIMAQSVVTALTKSPCAHLIYISSDAVYDDKLSLVNESSCCDPQSFHGCMHITREKILYELTRTNNIPFLRLRPTAIYGIGDTHNSYGPNRFLKTARESSKIQLTGKGEEQRDHLYIKDLCKVILNAIENRIQGVYNVASGKSYSFFDVATIVTKILEIKEAMTFTDRNNVITHKHFDLTNFYKAFPKITMTDLDKGLDEVIKEQN